MSHAKKFIANDDDRAKALPMFCGPTPKDVPPSTVKELPKSAARWVKKKNVNGGWDVSRGGETRHFATSDEADAFFDQMTFPERFTK